MTPAGAHAAPVAGSVLGWGLVQDKWFRTSGSGPSALILSPCRHMFRSWPEESAAHWAGSDEPSEGGGAGGGTAGGGLPLNFQHRSVQDGMSDLFQPPPAHSVHAEGGPAQLNSSSERANECGPNVAKSLGIVRHFSRAHCLGFHNWTWC